VNTVTSSRPGDILVIDDDAILRDLVTDWLEAAGYRVRKVPDCGAGVAELHRDAPALVVTDMFSHWAHEFTDLVLEGHTHVNTFWDSSASLSIILNLLINSTAAKLGKKAEAQFERMLEYGDHFQEFEKVRETLRRGTRLRLGR
jgi:hypothetical protein